MTAAPTAGGPPDTPRTVSVEGGGRYMAVTPAGLAAMLGWKDFLLVNVHIPYAGEIERTDRFVPFNDVGSQFARSGVRKDAKIVLYCRSGHMSTIAARALAGLGYTNVWNLEGGMVAWTDAGHALIRRP